MSLLTICLVLIVVGFVLWLITNYIPMERGIKIILIAIVVGITAIWVLKELNIFHYIKDIHV
jgi:hypothetical protein